MFLDITFRNMNWNINWMIGRTLYNKFLHSCSYDVPDIGWESNSENGHVFVYFVFVGHKIIRLFLRVLSQKQPDIVLGCIKSKLILYMIQNKRSAFIFSRKKSFRMSLDRYDEYRETRLNRRNTNGIQIQILIYYACWSFSVCPNTRLVHTLKMRC